MIPDPLAAVKTRMQVAKILFSRRITLENGIHATVHLLYSRCRDLGNCRHLLLESHLAHNAVLTVRTPDSDAPVQLVFYANVEYRELTKALKKNLSTVLTEHKVLLTAYNGTVHAPHTPEGKLLVKSVLTGESPGILALTTKDLKGGMKCPRSRT